MPVAVAQSSVTLTHPNGSSAEILLHGATVISWRTRSPQDPTAAPVERLYTSATAILDGSKPVRGGIPVVFPFFGPPSRPNHATLPQHGFARSSPWVHDDTLQDDAKAVAVRFVLPPRTPYPALAYTVTLTANTLASKLHCTNPAGAPLFAFQALFHTYLRADASLASVAGLQGAVRRDKLQAGHPESPEPRALVDVREPADSVYRAAGGQYAVHTGAGGVVHVHARNLHDVVVWNPGEAGGRKMADLEDGGWNMFICVEPGAATYWIDLASGESWEGEQVLSVE